MSNPAPNRKALTPHERFAWAALLVVVAPLVAWSWARMGRGIPSQPALDLDLLLRLGLYAVLEEIVFRGGMQAWLATRAALVDRHWLGISAANALTSLLFATAHGFAQSPLQAAAIFPVSLVFGLALEHSGRLAAPIGVHLYFNGLLWVVSRVLLSGT